VDVTAAKGGAGQVLLDPKNITISNGADSPSYTVTPLTYGKPKPDDMHGSGGAIEVSPGYIAVASPDDSTVAPKAGAVRLYKLDGELVSTLTGSQADDRVGLRNDGDPFPSIIPVGNGNYLVVSAYWKNGAKAEAGAVTFVNGAAGASGMVSSSNSLVGSEQGAQLGSDDDVITVLRNGNYLIRSLEWNNWAGAVTWGSGTTGVVGEISSSNSLVGSQAGDRVGWGGIIELNRDNYVVASQYWANGTASNAGAVTWGSGTAGVTGVVSSSNSLVGSTAGDRIGLTGNARDPNGVMALNNGNYVVASPFWAKGALKEAGAVTWGNGNGGTTGEISSNSSLVGSQADDMVGIGGVKALTNGNYVVGSWSWADGGVRQVGAVTWANGVTGISGEISSSNSLIGSQEYDRVGLYGNSITELSNSNSDYVVANRDWANGSEKKAGAVTWGSGTAGVSGVINSNNSLVGTTANDAVGSGGITALANGNYVVASPNWGNGSVQNAGAVTWGDGSNGGKGISGEVGSHNSLVGSQEGDAVGGSRITALRNGNYVVGSSGWAQKRGAVTWGSATAGVSGVVSSDNSLVGSHERDFVGSYYSVTELSNGNYVVSSPDWANGTAARAGAVTWVDGSKGISGEISSSNSLVGRLENDTVGADVTALTNGNYVVNSSSWANGTVKNAGAVTWVNGLKGLTGEINSQNSLVGSQEGDLVGRGGVIALGNGNYVVISPYWVNGTAAQAGAVTWGNGTEGVSGVVNSGNSLVGSQTDDQVGSDGIAVLSSGNYVVLSSLWANGAQAEAGAVTIASGATGMAGVVGSGNSLVGVHAGDHLGTTDLWEWNPVEGVRELSNGAVLVPSPHYNSGQGRVDILSLGQPNPLLYALDPGANYNLNVGTLANLLATGAQVTLQANTDISLLDALKVNSGAGGGLTLQAGRSILLHADVHTGNGGLTLIANDTAASGVVDAHRDAGAGDITQAAGTTIDAGTGIVSLQIRDGQGIANAQAGNITLARVLAGDLKIDSHGLTATLAAQNKVYDGGTAATATSAVTGLAFQAGSNLSFMPTTARFADKNVGTGKTVTADALQITGFHGTQASALHSDGQVLTPTATADISQRVLNVTATAANKVYDGNPAASIRFGDDRVAGDVLSLAGIGSFDNKNAGVGKTVTVGGISLAGADAGNYSFNTSATTQANITPRVLNVTATAANKVYDGNVWAQLQFVDDRLAGDVLSLAGSGSFDNKNAGVGKTVTVGGISLAGADAGNYSVGASNASTQADIGQRALHVVATAANKVYDGNTAASIRFSDDRVAGDVLSLAGIASFDTESVGRSKTVSIRGITLGGVDAGNYSFPTTLTALADITQRSAPLPDPDRQARDFIQQQERDFAEPTQTALDLTVWGAKAPAQQLQRLN
jgi:hypothetical protein